MPEIVFQHPLLGRHLRTRINMLQAASATGSEVTALRVYAHGAGLEYPVQLGKFETGFLSIWRSLYNLTRQCPIDKNCLSFVVRDATAFVIQGFNQ
jgi:hypothetical protein